MAQHLQFNEQFTEAEITGLTIIPERNVGDVYKASDTGNTFEVLEDLTVIPYTRFGSSINTPLINQVPVFNGTEWVNQTVTFINSIAKSVITNSGRFYCYPDDRWVTDSDDNYGPSYYQFSESGGAGANPIIEWEHHGMYMPAGTTLHEFMLAGRANVTTVSELEMYIVAKRPPAASAWETGIDADGEVITDTIYRGMYWNNTDPGQNTFSGGANDDHARKITGIDYLFTEDAYLSLYIKPTNTSTATRYFLSTYTYIVSYP